MKTKDYILSRLKETLSDYIYSIQGYESDISLDVSKDDIRLRDNSDFEIDEDDLDIDLDDLDDSAILRQFGI